MEVKECMEFLEGVSVVAVAGKQIMADGKVNMADIPVALGLMNDLGKVGAGVQGVDQMPAELKELSAEELQQLGAKVLEIIAKIKAA